MKADRWQQIDRLLDEAMALPPGERDAFLTHAAGDDEELRHEVASLLKAHDRAEGRFLDSPALEIAARGLAARREDSLIGKRFGAYQIISILGVGGMGEVYLARDERLGRRLALKILPSQFVADAGRIERFAREARAVSALNHPNIVTVYDIGQLDGAHFIAMEYVDGQTLREKIQVARHQSLNEKDVVEIALQISAALAAAHEAGIIHRDIKPENLMMRRDDYIKVLDFGLAKLTENQRSLLQTREDGSDPAATTPGAVLGTLRYMSPEQAMGEEVDGRSDIFSLGVALYELLTGSPPFKGDTPAAILDAVVHHAPLPLAQLRPDLNPEFERVVGKMLEKDRELRCQSAEELRVEFKRLKRELDSSPSHSINSGSNAGSIKPTGLSAKHKLIAAIAAVLALVAIAFSVWNFWPGDDGEASPWMAAYSTRLTEFPGEERTPSLSPDGKIVYYARQIKGQWDVFWQRVGGSNATNLTADSDADDIQPVCSPNGQSIVFRSERKGGGLFVMGATGENVKQVSSFGHNPSWSPDGQNIVCGTDYIVDPKRRVAKSRLLIINVATGEDRVLLEANDVAQPRWSPNGGRIAYFSRNAENRRDVWTIAADGSDAKPVTNDEAVDWSPVWSGDGKYLYFASDRKGVASLWRVRIDESTGRTLGKLEAVSGQSGEIFYMDLSRDGRRIVYSNFVADANIKSIAFDPIKLATIGEAVAVTQGTRPSGSPNLSPNDQPDEQMVVFHSLGAQREDIWLVRADGKGAQTNLTDDDWLDRSPRWSPDGKQIAFFSTRNKLAQIWTMNPDGGEKRQLTFTENGCSFPLWSPDGKLLAYQLTGSASGGGKRGTQMIETGKDWNQQTPVDLPAVNDAGAWFNAYNWSPDGKYIVGNVAVLQGKEVRGLPGIYLYSFETNGYKQLTEFGSRPEWLNDSRHVVFTHNGKGELADRPLWVIHIAGTIPKAILSTPNFQVSTLGLTRDSRRIFFTAVAHQADIFLLSLDK
ncbi:MAG: protein kinase domain-containing protein [Blastocatellia bacterium]